VDVPVVHCCGCACGALLRPPHLASSS
jgi:hypothetical protein